MDKWNRSLNPIYCSDPFTKEEDERLIDMVKEDQGNTSDWKTVSETFPLRHPRSLISRYVELTKGESTVGKLPESEVPI